MSTGRGWPKSSARVAPGASTARPSGPCTTKRALHYGITSLAPQTGPPDAVNLGKADIAEPGKPVVARATWRWRYG